MPPPMAVRLAADLRPSADGSAVRARLICGQPACLQPRAAAPWDRQTDGRIAVSLSAPATTGALIMKSIPVELCRRRRSGDYCTAM